MRCTTTVVVGAGQSGLAMSRELSLRSIDHLVLDRGTAADAWRTARWDSLRLLTPNWANVLPESSCERSDPDGYMWVGEFVAYASAYARRIGVPLMENTAVHRVSGSGSGYLVATSEGPIRCKTLVLATGACARPNVPALSAAVPAGIVQTTPSAYKRPTDLPEGGVLVAGASASGVQLAREIHASGRPVTLAVGTHVRLPRRYRGRDVEWWLDAIGALDERFDAVDDLARVRRTPSPQLIGGSKPVDLNALQGEGIEIVGRLADIRDGEALFSGGLANACTSADLKMNRLLDSVDEWIEARGLGAALPAPDRPAPTRLPASPVLRRRLGDAGIRSILWATGYRPDFSYLDMHVFDQRGRLRHHGGVCEAQGLYAMGLPFLRRRRSHQISGVGPDAADLATHLDAYLGGHVRIAA